MARTKSTHTPELAPVPTNTAALEQSVNEIAVRQSEIMTQFGDGLPYDRSRVVNEARFYMAQSAEAMLEAGKRLIVLKENEPHGDFMGIVEGQLGLADRTARLMMQATLKYSSPQLESKRQALAVLGKTKLFELMVADDEDLAELAEGGTVAGLTLDDVDRMTTRELRRALREARENAAATAKNLSRKDDKINELDRELTKLQGKADEPLVKTLPPDTVAADLARQATEFANEVLAVINGKLLPALRALDSHDQTYGSSHNVMAAGMVAQIEARLDELRGDFDLPRTLDGNSTPDWMRAGADDLVADAIEQARGA